MPALRQASASSARPLKVAGSPSMRRTTRPPWCVAPTDLAALTTSLARLAWVSGWPCSPWPASMISTSVADVPGEELLAADLVDDHGVGGSQELAGADGQQAGVAGAGADEDDARRVLTARTLVLVVLVVLAVVAVLSVGDSGSG